MIETIFLLILIVALILFLLYISIKETKLSKKTVLLPTTASIISILLVFVYIGTDKIKSDISRVIHNSIPKDSKAVYSVLFAKPIENCVRVINFKDQVISKIDCCIWMELQLCPSELKRIIALRNYTKARLNKSDSLIFLKSFNDRPLWWAPQLLGDSLIKYNIKFNQDKEQTLFLGLDSTHVYLCDQAL